MSISKVQMVLALTLMAVSRKTFKAWEVSTLTGDGTAGFADGAAATARFNGPASVAVDSSGILSCGGYLQHRIRKLEYRAP